MISRLSARQKFKRIAANYQVAEQVYYLYTQLPGRNGLTLVAGTDHLPTAELQVAQREAQGQYMVVVCHWPKTRDNRCVYATKDRA